MEPIEDYKPRLIDEKFDQLMSVFGAVSLVGAKFCGKTTCAVHHTTSNVSLMDPKSNYSSRTLAQMNPNLILDGPKPRLIDEWQEVPQIWDAVRFACDSDPKSVGSFVLTGSSIPSGYSHSGAGRIASIRMLPMSLYEMGDSNGAVSLEKLFDEKLTAINTGSVEVADLIRFVTRGGWPKLIDHYKDIDLSLAQEIPKYYLKSIVDVDFNKIGEFKRKKSAATISALLSSIGRNDCLPTSYSDFTSDIEDHSGISINRVTIPSYLEILAKLYVIEDQPAFTPDSTLTRNTLKMPKRRYIDPSLVIASLDKEPDMLYTDVPTLEAAYDNLCVHDLKVYSEAINAKLYYYKDAYGHTADSVVVLKDGRWGAFRHCISEHQVDKLATDLVRLKKSFENPKDQPSLLCIVCGTAPAAYTRPDGVVVVPLTALKP